MQSSSSVAQAAGALGNAADGGSGRGDWLGEEALIDGRGGCELKVVVVAKGEFDDGIELGVAALLGRSPGQFEPSGPSQRWKESRVAARRLPTTPDS